MVGRPGRPSACVISQPVEKTMNLEDLKKKKPPELLAFAEEQGVEGAAQMRRQELLFAILQKLAANDQVISGSGTIEVIPDGFGYLRSMEANYLPGADDIYVSPQQVRRFGLRTGDTVEGEIRAPKDRSEEHTSELQSRRDLVCRLLLEKKNRIEQMETKA